jgi:5-hydroxyisourate hydrolase
MSHVTTHVLDTARGRPAAGVDVVLADGTGTELARGTTDDDGRVSDLGPQLDAGAYQLTFAIGDYFARRNVEGLYPLVSIDFTIADANQHYHVPLLISPFAFSTYRGS